MGIMIKTIHIRNFISIFISEWGWIGVVFYTCGLIVLLFLTSLVLQIILPKNKMLQRDNKMKSSFIMGFFGSIYLYYFLIFLVIFLKYAKPNNIKIPNIVFYYMGDYFFISFLLGISISCILAISGFIWFFSRKYKLKNVMKNQEDATN